MNKVSVKWSNSHTVLIINFSFLTCQAEGRRLVILISIESLPEPIHRLVILISIEIDLPEPTGNPSENDGKVLY